VVLTLSNFRTDGKAVVFPKTGTQSTSHSTIQVTVYRYGYCLSVCLFVEGFTTPSATRRLYGLEWLDN